MAYAGFNSPNEEEEESQYFDARDDLSSASESSPSSPAPCQRAIPTLDFLHCVVRDLQPGFLAGKLESVEERRQRFMVWMRSNCMFSPRPGTADLGIPPVEEETADEDEIIASVSQSVRSLSELDAEASSMSGLWGMENLENEAQPPVDQRTNSNGMLVPEDFHQHLGPSSLFRRIMRREDNLSTSSSASTRRRRTKWLRRLGVAACIADREEDDSAVSSSPEADASPKERVRRVKVRLYKKPSKEFSGVYTSQEIRAHKGAILAMKFSPDGRYLATGGEDGLVRVWTVAAQERTFEDELPKDDPSSTYFSVNQNSGLSPIYTSMEDKLRRGKTMRRTPDSICIVVPTEVCRISEDPLHEFVGHTGDILDLSWSKNNLLLSSSTDKTARLWQVGRDSPAKVFSHGNYVTCVQFNPEDEGYFISGSIDGKVRIWEISSGHVANWIDVREIVTAVCFDPSGKGIVVGTISGRCLFYDSSGHRLQLVSVVLLQGKKKPACNRITGFQFCPTDGRKLLVTSADSQVRILEEHSVVCKFKGLRNSGSQISASYTADGRYVVSGSEDSHVYVWNTGEEDERRRSRWSSGGGACYESFPSASSSVAIPWPAASPPASLRHLVLSVSGVSAPTQGFFFSEFLKGSATWPEENLPPPPPPSAAAGRSQRKLLRTCLQSLAAAPPHAWGRVIVTGGWDGRIRSFHNYGLPVPA